MASMLALLLWCCIILVILLCIRVVFLLQKRKQYFKKHRIPYLGAELKTFVKFLTGSCNLITMEFEIYKKAKATNAPVVGTSLFGTLTLNIMDLDLVRNIYVKDFDHFMNRRPFGTDNSTFYFKKMLSGMDNNKWKGVRAKLSPAFTSGKIRRMFQIFKTSSERMDDYVKKQFLNEQKSMTLDFSEIFPKYAMDVIANCAFGIDSECWDFNLEKRSRFEQMGKQFQFKFSGIGMLKIFLIMLTPKLADMIAVEPLDAESLKYFVSVIKKMLKQRRQTGERRDDFIQLFIDAQQGLLNNEEESIHALNSVDEVNISETIQNKVTLDDDEIVGTALLFLLAGFDPTQSVLLFSLYNLALEPEVQEKLYQEVKSIMDENGGQMSYESVLQMKYLDMVIHETMRIFPPNSRTERGMRFALIKVKVAIAQLVSSYHFAPCFKTKIPPEFDTSANIKPKGGMWLNVTQRF